MTAADAGADTLWIIGELHGPFRGGMAKLVTHWQAELSLERVLASVGSSGHWPHCVAFWTASEAAWRAQLEVGLRDGFDENGVWWGETRVCRVVRGSLAADAGAFLIERVRTDRSLADLHGPDVVFADVFAPQSGYAVWVADGFAELAQREQDGIGVADQVSERIGWWATVVPEREMA